MSITVSSINRDLASTKIEQRLLFETMEEHIKNNTISLLVDSLKNRPCTACSSCLFEKLLTVAAEIDKETYINKSHLVFAAKQLSVITFASTATSIVTFLGSYLGDLTGIYSHEIDPKFMQGILFFQIIYCVFMRTLLTTLQSHIRASLDYMHACKMAYVDYCHFLVKIAINRNRFSQIHLSLLLQCSSKIREILSEDAICGDINITPIVSTLNNYIEELPTCEVAEYLQLIEDICLNAKLSSLMTSPAWMFDGSIFLLFTSLFSAISDGLPLIDARLTNSIILCCCLIGSLLFSLNTMESLKAFISKASGVLRPIRW